MAEDTVVSTVVGATSGGQNIKQIDSYFARHLLV